MEIARDTDRGLYLALAELARRHELAASVGSGPLTSFELRCFSQNGEDEVLAEIFARIGVDAHFFVEFGIETGQEGNCVYLADVVGWSGAFIEPNPHAYGLLEAKYAGSRIKTLNALIAPENVEGLFAECSVPREFDVLSIDVDGQDYWIWDAIEFYEPRVVVVEYNSALPPGRQLAQPRGTAEAWDGTDYFGASLAAFEHLARSKGYVLVHTELAALNAFFVREQLARGRFPADDAVPRRTGPNYYLRGVRHPADPRRRAYVDLETGQLAKP